MSDTEIDIYGDLPEFNYDDNLHELQATIDELLAKNDELFARMAQTKAEKEKTEENYNLLKKNMSSFILTAQKEVARKDKTIADLRKQIIELEKAKCIKGGRISSHERNGRQYSSSAEGERRKYGRRSSDLTRRPEPDENNIPDQRLNKEAISIVNKRNGYLSNSKAYNDDNRNLNLKENINNSISNLVKNNKNVQNHNMTVFSERMRRRIEIEKEKEKDDSKIDATPNFDKEASKVVNSKKFPEAMEEKDAKEILKPKNEKDSLTFDNVLKESEIIVDARNAAKSEVSISRKVSEEKEAKEISMSRTLTSKVTLTTVLGQKKIAPSIAVPGETTSNLNTSAKPKSTTLKNLGSQNLREKGTPSPFRIIRKRSSAYNPISSNWNVKNGMKKEVTPPTKSLKKDLSPSDLFGSDCSISDDDEDIPNIKLPPAVYEDSCSAQIDNSRFGKTDAIINEEKRPFYRVSLEKPKSIFSPQKSNTSNSFSSKQNLKVIEDSFMGQFETTTQFVAALAKPHAKLSPLRCSKSNEDVSEILAAKAQSVFHQTTDASETVNVLIPRKYPRVYSKVENKPNKIFSLKESFIFEQEEKVKNLNTENDKIIPVSPRKRIINKIDWVLQPLEPEPQTTIRRRFLNLDGFDSRNSHKNQIIENHQLSTNTVSVNNEKSTQNLAHTVQNKIICNSKIEDSINLKSSSQSFRNKRSSECAIFSPSDSTVIHSTPIIKVIKKRRKASLVNVDDPGKFSVARHRPINFSNTD